MNSDDFVENSDQIRYNIGNEHENKDGTGDAAPLEGELVEHIRKEDLKPLNDVNCPHTRVERDETEVLGFAYSCPDCGLGWLLDQPITEV